MEVIVAECIARPFLALCATTSLFGGDGMSEPLTGSALDLDTFVRPTSAVNLKLPADLLGFWTAAAAQHIRGNVSVAAPIRAYGEITNHSITRILLVRQLE